MAERYVVGVDGGTESLRAGVFDLRGRPHAFASSAYSTNFPQPSWAEQNPEDWWRALGLAPPGAEGLVVLDHFQGNRTPTPMRMRAV